MSIDVSRIQSGQLLGLYLTTDAGRLVYWVDVRTEGGGHRGFFVSEAIGDLMINRVLDLAGPLSLQRFARARQA